MQNEPIMTPDEPEVAGTQPEFEAPEHVSHFGLIIGVLITVLALILIGLYVWSQMMTSVPLDTTSTIERPTAAENNEPESTTAEARADTLDTVSPSDELSAIEADLEATNLDDFSGDFSSIEAEMETGVQ